ncbi:MAG: CHAT domain-containing protein [Aureispira sp.]
MQAIDVLYGKGEYQAAERRYKQLATKTKDKQLERYVQAQAGLVLAALKEGKQDEIFEELQGAELAIEDKKIKPVTQARLNLMLGKYHLIYKEYDLAMPLLDKTQKLSEQLGDKLTAPMHLELYHALGDLYRERGQKEKALDAYNKAIVVADQQIHEERNYEQLADIKILAGELYDEVLQPEEAIKRYETVLAQKDTLLADDPERAGELYYRLGGVYFKRKDYDAAEVSLNKALEYDITEQEKSDAKFMLSSIYFDRGKFKLALIFNSSALNNWSPKEGALPKENFKGFLQYGKLSSYQTGAKTAVNNYKEFTQQEESWTLESALKAIQEQKLIYQPQPELSDNYNISLLSYHRAGENVVKLPTKEQTVAEIDVQMAKGQLFFKTKNYSRAKGHFERALGLMKTIYEEKHPMVVEVKRSLSEVYLEEKIYQQAMRYIDQALAACLAEGDVPTGNNVPPIDDAKFPLELLYAIGTKGKVLKGLYNESGDKKHLVQSLAMFDTTIKLLNKLRRTYRREGSKYQLARLAKTFSKEASLVCYQLYALDQDPTYYYRAFDYIELAKGSLLLEAIRELKARKVVNIPDSVIQKEQVLKIEIAYLKGEIYTEIRKGFNKDLKHLVVLESQLKEVKGIHEELIKQLETLYPKYYELKYDFSTVKVEELQQLLQPQEVLLNYALLDSAVLIMGITANDMTCTLVKQSRRGLNRHIKRLRSALEGREKQKISKEGMALYKILLEPLEELIEGKDLIIIPDGTLNNLPFETLIKKTQPQLEYVLFDNAICYNYSATVYMVNQRQKSPINSKEIVGFAPDFAKIDSVLKNNNLGSSNLYDLELEPLAYAKEEVDALARLFKQRSQSFTGLAATETQVKQSSGKYGVLHFATHGLVNHSDPMYSSLAFAMDGENDGLLYTHELFSLELNAGLVTLSACNSGVGKLYEGEGMMSLARGFAYSGAPNLITTLWPVSDQATQIIMKNFYQHLQEGLPKHRALQQAKKDFIEEYRVEDEQAYLWGGLIVVGNTSPVDVLAEPSSWSWWWTVAAALLLIVVGYLIMRIVRANAAKNK